MKNNPELNELHNSFAVVLCTIMKACGVITPQEREEFNAFFSQEFSLSSENINILFLQAKNETRFDRTHLAKLKEAFEGHDMLKAHFMDILNQCILCDGIQNNEYEVFEIIRKALVEEK